MTRKQGVGLMGLAVALVLGVVWVGLAGEGFTTSVYEGQIRSVRIDKCGLQPGLCEGSIVLAQKGGGDTALDIRVGTWIRRGDRFLTIEDLKPGENVRAQAFRLPGERNPRAAILEFTTRP